MQDNQQTGPPTLISSNDFMPREHKSQVVKKEFRYLKINEMNTVKQGGNWMKSFT